MAGTQTSVRQGKKFPWNLCTVVHTSRLGTAGAAQLSTKHVSTGFGGGEGREGGGGLSGDGMKS